MQKKQNHSLIISLLTNSNTFSIKLTSLKRKLTLNKVNTWYKLNMTIYIPQYHMTCTIETPSVKPCRFDWHNDPSQILLLVDIWPLGLWNCASFYNILGEKAYFILKWYGNVIKNPVKLSTSCFNSSGALLNFQSFFFLL